MKLYCVSMLVSLLFICSCSGNKRLEFALEFAGDNRGELEKVLEHYKDSGQKYDAARFLIENMPYYFTYTGGELDSIKVTLAAIAERKKVSAEARKYLQEFSLFRLDRVYDAHVITADYLIENIDLAFAAWKGKPWSRALSFEDFCEWILPYRIGDEPLEHWRKVYADRYQPILDSVYQGKDPVVAIDSLESVLKSDPLVYDSQFTSPRLGALFLMEHRVGSCREASDVSLYMMRALGFPVGIDSYLYSPVNRFGHSWNVLKDTTGQTIPFWYVDTRIRRGQGDGRKKGKVYRLCYALQEERLRGMYASEEVPSVLKNPFLKDVTADYFGENETAVDVDGKLCGEYVYLGVFTANGWTAIDIAEHRAGKAMFRNVEPGLWYMPLAAKNGMLSPVGFPFQIEGGDAHYLRPGSQVEGAKLWRKYPLGQSTIRYMNSLVGAKIEVSDTPDFRQAKWAHIIEQAPKISYNAVCPSSLLKGRYVRFTAAASEILNLAELSVYGEDNRKINIRGVQGSASSGGDARFVCDKVNDDDCLTYFRSDSIGGSVTLDLGQRGLIRKIVYMPRSDDNFVHRGETYELFYQNGSQGWVSLGRRVADKEYLEYDNIPVGTLLWLRNLTKGREEQVFVLKNGEQVFGE